MRLGDVLDRAGVVGISTGGSQRFGIFCSAPAVAVVVYEMKNPLIFKVVQTASGSERWGVIAVAAVAS